LWVEGDKKNHDPLKSNVFGRRTICVYRKGGWKDSGLPTIFTQDKVKGLKNTPENRLPAKLNMYGDQLSRRGFLRKPRDRKRRDLKAYNPWFVLESRRSGLTGRGQPRINQNPNAFDSQETANK